MKSINLLLLKLLDKTCKANTGKGIQDLIQNKQYKTVVEQLLLETGLNYGSLPKGLLLFHSYPTEKRTPMQEHLVEGAMYASNAKNEVNLHLRFRPNIVHCSKSI